MKKCLLIALLLAACNDSSNNEPEELSDFVNYTLTWQDNSDNEDEFIIYRRSADEIEYTGIAYLFEDSTSYVDEYLDASVDFCYKVAASNEFGESYSNEVCSSD